MHNLKIVFAVILTWLFSTDSCNGFVFGEHRWIGDAAFKSFIESNTSISEFLRNNLGVYWDAEKKDYIITLFPDSAEGVSYGDFTGLSGDHDFEPMRIFKALQDNSSPIIHILRKHWQAIADGDRAASDLSLALIDCDYLSLAIEDSSHFYEFGLSSREEQLKRFGLFFYSIDFEKFRNDFDNYKDTYYKALWGSNDMTRYTIVHLTAIDMARNAGKQWKLGRFAQAKKRLQYAFLFNAFADHYLQDAFSSGHLAVNRFTTGVFDCRGQHNFYCRNIINEHNKLWNAWPSYGDEYLDTNSIQFAHAVTTNVESLNDLWQEFTKARDGNPYIPKVDSLIKARVFYESNFSDLSKVLLDWFPVLNLFPDPIKQNEIPVVVRSRNGGVFSFEIGGISAHAEKVSVFSGLAYYFGINLKDAPKDELIDESRVWISAGLESLFSLSGFRFLGGVKTILFDRWTAGLSQGYFRNSDSKNGSLTQLRLGYEYKSLESVIGSSLYFYYHFQLNEVGAGLQFSFY